MPGVAAPEVALSPGWVFVLIHGPRDGGKSTFVDSGVRTLGTSARKGDGSSDDDSGGVTRYYAETTSIETFGRQGSGNKPELAYLMGARVVVVNEIPEGKALESRTMKAWTGGDAIEATPKYGHPLKFYPDGTIFLVGNELPEIEFKDDAMWERVLVVPFTLTIPEEEQIKALKEQFDPRAILAWMVEGHREYRERGLAPPPAARLAKEAHRLAADPLAEFWEDCTALDRGSRVSKQELYARYRSWAERCGIKPADRLTQAALTRAANKRAELTGHFREAKSGSWRGWRGLRLVDSVPSPEGDPLA